MTPRSKVLVLTNPNNPDGRLPTRAEVDELLALAARHGLTVVTDEAYERCIHDGELASAWGAPNVILVRSLGKSLAMPAWRIGFVAAEPAVIDALPPGAGVGRDPRQPRRPAGGGGCARRPAGLAGRGGGRLPPRPGRRPRGRRRPSDPERPAAARDAVPLARPRRALVGEPARGGDRGRRRRPFGTPGNARLPFAGARRARGGAPAPARTRRRRLGAWERAASSSPAPRA